MIRTIVDCETNTSIEVEMTPEEVAELEALQADAQANMEAAMAQAEAKAAAKASAIEKLSTIAGLTPEEIAAL